MVPVKIAAGGVLEAKSKIVYASTYGCGRNVLEMSQIPRQCWTAAE